MTMRNVLTILAAALVLFMAVMVYGLDRIRPAPALGDAIRAVMDPVVAGRAEGEGTFVFANGLVVQRMNGVFRTHNGPALKVIVNAAGVYPRNKVSGERNGDDFSLFDILYVKDIVDPSGRKGGSSPDGVWFAVAVNPASDALGWLPGSDVYIWEHRNAIRPVKTSGSSASTWYLYETAEDARQSLRDGMLVEPIAKIALVDANQKKMPVNPWPILDKTIAEHDGEPVQIYHVATVAESGQVGGNRYSRQERDIFRQQLRQVDLRIVCDATGSMRTSILETKAAVRSFAESLAATNPELDLRVGLSTYRDHDDGEEMAVTWPLMDVEAFCRAVDGISAKGGGDDPEAGYFGIMHAFNHADFRTRSERIMIVVGDSPYHTDHSLSNPAGLTTRDILAEAAKHSVRIYAVGVGSDAGDRNQQFSLLSEPTGGRLLQIRELDALRGEITSLLQANARDLQLLNETYESLEQGRNRAQISRDLNIPTRQVTYYVELLQSRDIDASRLGPNGEVGLRGWLVPAIGSSTAGVLEVYLFRTEAEKIRELVLNIAHAKENIDIGPRLLNIGLGGRTMEFSMADILQSDFLPHRNSSILQYSRRELMMLGESDRNSLREAALTIAQRLHVTLTDNRYWYRLPDNRIVGWIPEFNLP